MSTRVLLMAEACNPEWTSVPLVGYNFARALAENPQLDVTLVSHVRNQDALQQDPIADAARLVFINNEWIAKPLYTLGRLLRGGKSLGWTTNMAVNWPAYIAFELQAARQLQSELKAGAFDIIHRITPVSPTLPSALATKTDVPMVIGPLNGGLPWPKEYPQLRGKEREWLVPVRNVYRKLPWYAKSYRALAGVIAGSRHTQSETPDGFSGQRLYMPENGIDPAKFEIAAGWTPPSERFQFVSVGRLVPYKGFHLTLQAMAASPVLRECDFVIIGDGPEKQRLTEMAADLGLADRVTFAGWMLQQEVAGLLRASQAFVFPSLREFGGGVVLEAMASGLPSIIVDYGGPSELIDGRTGIAIPLQEQGTLIPALTESMEQLATNPMLCEAMASAALGSVRENHVWSAKAKRMATIYQQLLADDVSDTAVPPTSAVEQIDRTEVLSCT